MDESIDKCYENCGLEKVKPGKFQCWCDSPEEAENYWREKIAEEIESRICNVVHNETNPQSCEKMNDGLRIAAYIARGQK